jgi:ribose transport system permease protein
VSGTTAPPGVDSPGVEPSELESRPRDFWRTFVSSQQFILVVALVILIGFFFSRNHLFVSSLEFSNLITDFSGLSLLAVAEMYVIVSGGIDLSVGSTVAVSGILGAFVMKSMLGAHDPQVLVLLCGTIICALAGAAVGAINALMITKAHLVPFVATLVTLSAGAGLALVFTGGLPVGLDPTAVTFSATGWGPFSYPAMIIIVIVVVLALYLHGSRYGRYTFAIGSNQFAARAAGINVQRHLASIYVLAGALAGLTGMFFFLRLGSGAPTSGDNAELTAIAAVVIGGANLMGGSGRMSGTILGACVLTVVTDGLIFINIQPTWDQVVVGAFIFFAAALQALRPSSRSFLRLIRRAPTESGK